MNVSSEMIDELEKETIQLEERLFAVHQENENAKNEYNNRLSLLKDQNKKREENVKKLEAENYELEQRILSRRERLRELEALEEEDTEEFETQSNQSLHVSLPSTPYRTPSPTMTPTSRPSTPVSNLALTAASRVADALSEETNSLKKLIAERDATINQLVKLLKGTMNELKKMKQIEKEEFERNQVSNNSFTSKEVPGNYLPLSSQPKQELSNEHAPNTFPSSPYLPQFVASSQPARSSLSTPVRNAISDSSSGSALHSHFIQPSLLHPSLVSSPPRLFFPTSLFPPGSELKQHPLSIATEKQTKIYENDETKTTRSFFEEDNEEDYENNENDPYFTKEKWNNKTKKPKPQNGLQQKGIMEQSILPPELTSSPHTERLPTRNKATPGRTSERKQDKNRKSLFNSNSSMASQQKPIYFSRRQASLQPSQLTTSALFQQSAKPEFKKKGDVQQSSIQSARSSSRDNSGRMMFYSSLKTPKRAQTERAHASPAPESSSSTSSGAYFSTLFYPHSPALSSSMRRGTQQTPTKIAAVEMLLERKREIAANLPPSYDEGRKESSIRVQRQKSINQQKRVSDKGQRFESEGKNNEEYDDSENEQSGYPSGDVPSSQRSQKPQTTRDFYEMYLEKSLHGVPAGHPTPLRSKKLLPPSSTSASSSSSSSRITTPLHSDRLSSIATPSPLNTLRTSSSFITQEHEPQSASISQTPTRSVAFAQQNVTQSQSHVHTQKDIENESSAMFVPPRVQSPSFVKPSSVMRLPSPAPAIDTRSKHIFPSPSTSVTSSLSTRDSLSFRHASNPTEHRVSYPPVKNIHTPAQLLELHRTLTVTG
ncbi:uncharacterized protein MONOS_14434 [Monocercomonoides exilis]|uniref:uncharacterized protein n=1 Tax=Monocercomonoides exilis TaxID=2049356 RepID=UPI0035597D81|nr:hypothetical protein MONOS_14434 [Monocercomonoides exilis]|eukprot:MONOS_14434.1-p1 / transcript=MONOS_14434.1 / gene=MONOS_14434 / organism=Monocercomonoides_exilis_PA203 / gene_product=unspecified product / transcript_product=unspecified product / location=Mono_scaffold01001:5823-8303(-) / protein_length=827 / sequence_SO=supercontig / SO=protein_coding / is_pseudo=false